MPALYQLHPTTARSSAANSHPRDTPLAIFAKGALAGVGATAVVSVLSRLTFGTMDGRARSPAPRRHPAEAITPGEALARAADAGPEGSAGKFALKTAAGFFGRDISRHARAAGEAVHFAYGTFWGGMFALAFASERKPSLHTAACLGLGLWAIGPATLVPAMKLVPPVRHYPIERTLLLVAGHLVYSWTTLGLFQKLRQR
jgi:hypothetical protein